MSGGYFCPMTEKFRLDGRVAVVTGGGRGIGLAIAEAFVDAGSRTVIAEIDRSLGHAAVDRLGPSAEFIELDVARSADVGKAAAAVVARHGRVDVLVNNAGICLTADAVDTSDEIWRRQLAVNLDGVFFCCREFGRYMIRARRGSIVNVSSIAGVIDVRPQNHVGYDASKAAIVQMARALASEWAIHGVRVNAIAPGYVATTMPQMEPGRMEAWLSMIPIGRMIEPNEIAAAVLFLASDAASAVTGHLLLADGGYTVW
jgi:NAD(P)-dependent dehydrogenase (short-subunit alcohol dehydrogenase family)